MGGIGWSCAARRQARADYGIPRCPAGAAGALLSSDALQCWFDADHGRWRILSHVAFQDALVVQIETSTLRDADAIAADFVAGEGRSFSEIVVYARAESPPRPSRLRRIRWTPGGGFDVLEVPVSDAR